MWCCSCFIILLVISSAYSDGEVLRFKQPWYILIYKDGDLDSRGEIISLENNITNVTFSLDGIYAPYFELVSNKIRVNSTNPIDVSRLLQKKAAFLLTVIATKENTTAAFANVLITYPNKAYYVEFENSFYNATYSADGTLMLENIKINVDMETELNIKISGKYESHFELVVMDKATHTYKLQVKTPLEPSILKEESDMSLVLTASINNTVSDSAVVYINFNTPHFTKLMYNAIYHVDKDSIEWVNDEKIEVTPDNAVITILSPYDHDFSYVNQQIKINNNEIINLKQEIVLEVQANVPETNSTTTALVSVKLPPKFKQSVYLGNYIQKTDSNDVIDIVGGIGISFESDDKPPITIEGDNVASFDGNYTDNIFEIRVVQNLDQDLIDTKASIVLTLKTKVNGICTLIISLPKRVQPASFSNPEYSFKYVRNQGNEKDTIEPENNATIKLVGSHVDATNVTLTGNYTEYFRLSHTEPFSIKLEKNLKDSIFYEAPEIVLTLEAKLDDSPLIEKALVVISLPEVTKLAFSKKFYIAQYELIDGKPSIELQGDNVISIPASDATLVTVTAQSPYEKNFSISYHEDKKGYLIFLNNDLNLDDEIYVQLDATVDNLIKDSAVLIVKPIVKLEQGAPSFLKNYYKGIYKKNNGTADTIETTEDIITDVAEEAAVKVTGAYENNFRVQPNDKKWEVLVTKSLDDTVLNSGSDVIISLEVSLKSSNNIGSTIVVVELPTPTQKPAPLFTKTSYKAEYTVQKDTPQIKMISEPITITGDYMGPVAVSVDDNTHNFVLDCSKSVPIQCNVSINSPLQERGGELALTLRATLFGHLDATATLLIQLPSSTITFQKPFYKAEYAFTGSNATLSSEDITAEDTNAGLVVQEYEDYFYVSEVNNKFQVHLKQALPDGVLKNNTFLAIPIIGANKEQGSTVLVVQLPVNQTQMTTNGSDNTDKNDKTLIAVIAVLAVLLVAAVVGSIAFYFLKFRRSNVPYKRRFS